MAQLARSKSSERGEKHFESMSNGCPEIATTAKHDTESNVIPPWAKPSNDAQSHLHIKSWTSVSSISLSRCTHDYMPWFFHSTHPTIQNPDRLPRGVQCPTPARPSPSVVLDMITLFIHPDTTDESRICGYICRIMKDFYLRSD
ncbi:hypothetical protein M9H77_04847 [Catharanthus roseus]|uniref:Uncharacterized protein n=1 Tax=Catharanthus roseus TaxID=4058 RepID=A0ACC0CFF5_CATRO|nr:hypothetical protein M9H77_04847 [Catharanthus roseus]